MISFSGNIKMNYFFGLLLIIAIDSHRYLEVELILNLKLKNDFSLTNSNLNIYHYFNKYFNSAIQNENKIIF